MADPAKVPARENAAPAGLIVGLLTLPIRLFGALCASLLLSVLIECLGMHFLWQSASWHHAQGMLRYELQQISSQFTKSLVLSHPAESARHLISTVRAELFSEKNLAAWGARARTHPLSSLPHIEVVRHTFSLAFESVKPYALAAGYTVLTFLARLLVIALTVPLYLLAALVGFIDGLVRRDLRRYSCGHESGFLYHRARAAIAPATILPWVVYLALPVSVSPLLILLPAAILLALAINITAAHFKKYL
jgi:integrating conjugative element membrane protein (TIGR03747 family)